VDNSRRQTALHVSVSSFATDPFSASFGPTWNRLLGAAFRSGYALIRRIRDQMAAALTLRADKKNIIPLL
jgi:hypothetical protein